MLRDILDNLGKIALEIGASQPFLCGGTPRDKLLNNLDKIEDIDITTGDKSVFQLAKSFADKYNSSLITMKDNHCQVNIDNIKVDFSSNYISPNAGLILNKMGIKPDNMMLELYSRDFTINALLMSTDLKTIYDPTGKGIPDIKSKVINTCLPAKFTLRNDNKRIVRIIYLACKLDFVISDDIMNWVKANPEAFANAKPEYLSTKLQKALNYNESKAIELIGTMGLWKYVPPLPALVPHIGRSLI